MSRDLDEIERQLGGRNYSEPPLEQWHPELSGDIDILIAADGRWYHEGSEISREAIWKLFASIMRRESDGEYYLVTPVEKWRIQVDGHPLRVVDVNLSERAQEALTIVLNTGRSLILERPDQLYLDKEAGNIAAVKLPHGLSALFSRPAWYRLVELADYADDRLKIAGFEVQVNSLV